MAVKKENRNRTGFRVFIGGLFFVLSLIMLLALFSYDCNDIYIYSYPPNFPPVNFIGKVGAWSSFAVFIIFGLGSYTLPLWFAILGLFFVISKREHIWPKVVWSVLSLLTMASLIDLHELFISSADKLNISYSGGILSGLVTRGLLIHWFSPIGTGIVIWSLFLLSLLMLTGPQNLLKIFYYFVAICEVFIARMMERASGNNDRRELIEKEERQLEKKRKRLEKAMRKKEMTEEIQRKADAKNKQKSKKSFLKTDTDKSTKKADVPPPASVTSLAVDPDTARFPGYVLPPMTLLKELPKVTGSVTKKDTDATAEILVDTLEEFGISTEFMNVETGPVVASYELLPAKGVRVERIANLNKNIALALKATSIRVQAPIPGKGVVGIEVPNTVANLVFLRELLESRNWRTGNIALPLALGKDVGGKEVVADLAKMPHLLIAGATGSGKSVCINSILSGLLMSRTPDELRMILIDPKIVEFSVYNNLPHLVVPVITDPKKVVLSLRWAINEMEKRYKLFAKAKVRNIQSFNNREKVKQTELFDNQPATSEDGLPDRVPYIVIVIDELADLMLAAGADIENSVARLAQLSRAVGIHMIIATQRPSVNVITGTIKANFPARIAFQVASKIDSRTILDQGGADKLLGMGDMLYLPPASSKLIRAQGAMIADDEVHNIVDFIKEQAEPSYEMEIKNKLEKARAVGAVDTGEDDELLSQSVEIIKETHRASTSSLQRRLRIGYTRAARIMDILEERGIIGPPKGSDPREILIDLDVEVSDTENESTDESAGGETDDSEEVQ